MDKRIKNKSLTEEWLDKINKCWSPNNIISPKNISCGVGKKYYFICPDCDSEYYIKIIDQVKSWKMNNSGCTYCRGFKTNEYNSLQTLFPGNS